MTPRFLSLVEPTPPGFEPWSRPPHRSIRLRAFALLAPTFAAGQAAVESLAPQPNGILVVPTAEPWQWAHSPDGLHRLTVPMTGFEQLPAQLSPLLDLLDTVREHVDRAAHEDLELNRAAEDRRRLTEDYSSFRENLLHEINERRVAERALRDSEERFRAIYDFINDAIFLHDAETGAIVDVNRRAGELFGLDRESLIKTCTDKGSAGAPPYDEATAINHVRLAAQGSPQLFEWQGRHSSGRLFWVEMSMRCALVGGQNRVLAVARDITERKQAEESRQRLESRMRDAQKWESLGVLTAGIAHDFNNMLTVILGHAEVGRLKLHESDPLCEQFDEIRRASEQAADLCRQMLACSGRGTLEVRAVDIGALARQMTHMLKVSLGESVQLSLECDPSLPSIEGDEAQIRQVILNLIINAGDAVDAAAGEVKVRVMTRHCSREELGELVLGQDHPAGRYVVLEVGDNGCGMDTNTQARIFDPFFTTKVTGRGLGLSTLVGIVRGHQGAIGVDSRTGEGTTFRVYFPAATGFAEVSPVATGEFDEWRGSGALLLADDEPSVRELTCLLLERMGFSVIACADGTEAVDRVRARLAESHDANAGFVAGVFDRRMGGLDGEKTLATLRELGVTFPVLIVTGHADADLAVRLAEHGPCDLLVKPFPMNSLRGRLRGLLAMVGKRT